MQTPEQVYDLHARAYDKALDDPVMRFYEAVTWDNVKQFLPEDKENSLLLDIGGGTGRWSVPLAREGYHVVLGDVSQGMLNIARDKLRAVGLSDMVDVRQIDICDMSSLAEASFDLVLCQGDPLSYVKEPAKAAAECFRVAKPGAFFIPSVDCRFRPAVKLGSMAEWGRAMEVLETGVGKMVYEEGSFPIHMFTPQELIGLLESAGWEVGQLIGKTVLGSLLPGDTLAEFVNNPQRLHNLLQLEKQLGAEPSLIGIAGHIEAVCRKPEKGES